MVENESASYSDTLEKNKEVYLRTLYEYWSQGKTEVMEEIMADGYVKNDQEVQFEGTPLEYANQRLKMYRSAAPDVTFKAEVLIAEGDIVACYYKGSGTHTGELFGIPPTGKEFTFKGVDIVRIVDGKIVEGWDVPDLFGLMRQLGLIPI